MRGRRRRVLASLLLLTDKQNEERNGNDRLITSCISLFCSFQHICLHCLFCLISRSINLRFSCFIPTYLCTYSPSPSFLSCTLRLLQPQDELDVHRRQLVGQVPKDVWQRHRPRLPPTQSTGCLCLRRRYSSHCRHWPRLRRGQDSALG